MRKKIITLTVIAVSSLGGAIAIAVDAQAASWRSCSAPWSVTREVYTDNDISTGALSVRSPMNCDSGRYALRMARSQFRLKGYLPRRFNDGYVTWRGWIVSGNRLRGIAQYTERESGTSFKFRYIW